MASGKNIDRICVAVTLLALLLTLLFMNGEALGLQKAEDGDAVSDSGYFTANDLRADWDTESATAIELNGSSGTVHGGGAYFYQGNLVISSGGWYVLSGTLEDGYISIDTGNSAKVWLLLDGVQVSCSDNACLRVENAKKVFVTLAEGTENSFSSGETYSEAALADGTGGVIYAHDDLTLNGSGSLTLTAAYKHGIEANDTLAITGGSLSITCPQDGLHVNDACNLREASVTIAAGDDGIHSDTSVYVESGTVLISECSEGIEAPVIELAGGDVTIYPTDDGLNASSGASTDGFGGFGGPGGFVGPGNFGGFGERGGGMGGSFDPTDVDLSGIDFDALGIDRSTLGLSEDDDLQHVDITQLDLSTVDLRQLGLRGLMGSAPQENTAADDGASRDNAAATTSGSTSGSGSTNSRSGSGADGNNSANGNSSASSSDANANNSNDSGSGNNSASANASENTSQDSAEEVYIRISGGNLTIVNENARDADGIDSNGSIYITGGSIRVSMANSGGYAMDVGSESGGVMEISGGDLIGCGSYSMAESFDSSSTQPSILYIYSAGAEAGTTVSLEYPDGTEILSYTAPCSFSCVNLSCPEMELGGTYRIVIGDNTEEITLSDVSASFGDARSGAFGGPMNFGGMRPGGRGGGFPRGSASASASGGAAGDASTASGGAVSQSGSASGESEKNHSSDSESAITEGFAGTFPEGFDAVPPEGFAGTFPEDFGGALPEGLSGTFPADFDGTLPEGFDGTFPEDFDGTPPDFDGTFPENFDGMPPMNFGSMPPDAMFGNRSEETGSTSAAAPETQAAAADGEDWLLSGISLAVLLLGIAAAGFYRRRA